MVQPCSLHSHLRAEGQFFRWQKSLIRDSSLREEEDNTVSGPTGASEIYEKQGEYGSAPTLLLEHAEMLCHLKRHHSISKQLKILLN